MRPRGESCRRRSRGPTLDDRVVFLLAFRHNTDRIADFDSVSLLGENMKDSRCPRLVVDHVLFIFIAIPKPTKKKGGNGSEGTISTRNRSGFILTCVA